VSSSEVTSSQRNSTQRRSGRTPLLPPAPRSSSRIPRPPRRSSAASRPPRGSLAELLEEHTPVVKMNFRSTVPEATQPVMLEQVEGIHPIPEITSGSPRRSRPAPRRSAAPQPEMTLPAVSHMPDAPSREEWPEIKRVPTETVVLPTLRPGSNEEEADRPSAFPRGVGALIAAAAVLAAFAGLPHVEPAAGRWLTEHELALAPGNYPTMNEIDDALERMQLPAWLQPVSEARVDAVEVALAPVTDAVPKAPAVAAPAAAAPEPIAALAQAPLAETPLAEAPLAEAPIADAPAPAQPAQVAPPSAFANIVIEQLQAEEPEPTEEEKRATEAKEAAEAELEVAIDAYDAALAERVPRRRGRVAVLHADGKADVFHEKRKLGATPGVFVLRPGRYKLRVVGANGEEEVRRVRVRKHRTTKLDLR